MADNSAALLTPVADYYSEKLAQNGTGPKGVDWNGTESQTLRFRQLCRIIAQETDFSLNDLGCGYGAMLEYLQSHYANFSYAGTDISITQIEAAKKQYADVKTATFRVSSTLEKADYTIASGIFNVRLETPDDAWLTHIHQTLDMMHEASRKGFAFNCLTSYSDAERMRGYLYYTDPCALFDRCKRRYSRNVALLHDYGLYEFTLLVTQEA